MCWKRLPVILALVAVSVASVQAAESVMPLSQGWRLQSSAKIKQTGEILSRPSYKPEGWHEVTVPTTVVAALVKNNVYPDPYFGKNLRAIPGTTYPINENFSNLPMPADSPFAVPWWYRTEFQLPTAAAGKRIALHFGGINYRANIWLNGRQIAKADDVAGAWRLYEFDITDQTQPGTSNALAVEVFAPKQTDLAITFVDWNPLPPDKDMGLWRRVYLTTSGPVTLRHPFVESKIDLPSAKTARLTVSAELENHTKEAVRGTLKGAIGDVQFAQPVELAAGELKEVLVGPQQFPQLTINNPRLWWPAQMGKPELYDLDLSFVIDDQVSDHTKTRFGIREITAELTAEGYKLFKINGKRILIRGAGWSPDMMLRESTERLEKELRYVLDLNLNTIRLEGKLETEEFFDRTDEYGILVMAGWCCCDAWELWKNWKPPEYTISALSLRDQIYRLRGRPSLLLWAYASDIPPPPDVERSYLKVLKQLRWPNPALSSTEHIPTKVTGPSGVKEGVYQYVPPSFWLLAATPEVQKKAKRFDNTRAGAFGFTTETGPGPAPPPVESLRLFLPKEHLWPVDYWWNYHAGLHAFTTLDVFNHAMDMRYGKPRDLQDYTIKAQVMAYEGERAMFEAYNRNKYRSTGVIQWMLNNAWPGIIWHLYDYYLRPGGGYFGSKKALEPLHPQYSYDDNSVSLISSQYQDAKDLKLEAAVYNFDLSKSYYKRATVDAPADSSKRVFTLPQMEGQTTTYFLLLTLDDSSGKRLSSNLYWLSTKPDVMNWPKVTYSETPALQYGDFTSLNRLPKTSLRYSSETERQGDEFLTHVTIKNPGKNLAFFVRLKANSAATGDEILPVLWEDNYFSLLPGEERQITARHSASDVSTAKIAVTVEGWNVRPQ